MDAERLKERIFMAANRISDLERELVSVWKERDFLKERLKAAHLDHLRTRRVARGCIYSLLALLALTAIL